MYYTHLEFKLGRPWKPNAKCVSYPENYTEPSYDYNEYAQTAMGQKMQYWYMFTVNSLQVIPILISIIYPVLAALILFELVKAAQKSNKVLSNRSSNEKHRTGKMILVMTVFYVLSSAPNGIMNFYMFFFVVDDTSILGILFAYGSIFMSFLYCVTATSHSLICFGMSTEYRNTAKKLLGIKKENVVVSQTPSVNPQNSHP